MKYPNFNEEKKLWKKGFNFVVGLDEAGRGPLAGPVAAAVVLIKSKTKNHLIPQNYADFVEHSRQNRNSERKRAVLKPKIFEGINDSKKLSEKQRNYFYRILTNHENIKWGIGIVSEKVIDKINILNATKLSMVKAIDNLVAKSKIQNPKFKNIDYLLIDGNFKIKSKIPQKSIIKGDQKVMSIAMASIIAKVTRDRIMEKFHKKYPQYRFDKHKGYPTELHVKMLKKFGDCPIHRKSFYPVSALQNKLPRRPTSGQQK